MMTLAAQHLDRSYFQKLFPCNVKGGWLTVGVRVVVEISSLFPFFICFEDLGEQNYLFPFMKSTFVFSFLFPFTYA